MGASDQVLEDLIDHIREQGGSILSKELAPFYAKHPGHRLLIGRMKTFCEKHAERLSMTIVDWPIYRIHVLGMPETVEASDLDQSEQLLKDLVKFIELEGGGSLGCDQLAPFYKQHPEHRTLLKSMGLSINAFCKQHPSRIRVGRGDGPHLWLHVLAGARPAAKQETKVEPAVTNGTKTWVVKGSAGSCRSDPDMEGMLRSVLINGAVDLFALPELLDLPNNSETCHDLLSFMKERLSVFKVSKDDLGYKASLTDSSFSDQSTQSPHRNFEDEAPASPTGSSEAEKLASDGTDGVQDLFSCLKSKLLAADGRLPLAVLERDEDCKASCKRHFLQNDDEYVEFQDDLGEYLREHCEHFRLWPWEGSTMVSWVGLPASVGRWKKAQCQVEIEQCLQGEVLFAESEIEERASSSSPRTAWPQSHVGRSSWALLLPSRLSLDEEILRDAHRLIFQPNEPLKVALRSGWRQRELPEILEEDLMELARRFGWRGEASLQITGTPHRASFGMVEGRLRWITVHVGRTEVFSLVDIQRTFELLKAGSLMVIGAAGAGKTTLLRELAMSSARKLQVLVLDARDLGPVPGARYLQGTDVSGAIEYHVPELLVSEFPSFEAALEAGRLCSEAGVLLCCAVRGSFRGMVDAFARQGPREQRDLACLSFPFATVLALARNGQAEVVHAAAQGVCCADPRRLPSCPRHHVQRMPGPAAEFPAHVGCAGPMFGFAQRPKTSAGEKEACG